MQAVILIGGMGTRLRPFTLRTPKPLSPILNRPFLDYQFEILKRHGVREVILCTAYRAEEFRGALRHSGLKTVTVHEKTPLGTGGALKNAQPLLKGPALVLNGDILNGFDLSAFRAFHRRKKPAVSIALTSVKDPTQYGLVIAESGAVRRFVEKPSWDEVVTHTVSTGVYLFEREALDLIPEGRRFSLERELFPELVKDGRVAGWETADYWMDIGTVGRYLQAHLDVLGGKTPFKPLPRWAKRLRAAGGAAVAMGRSCRVHPQAHFSGAVALGDGVRVGKSATLADCVVLDGAVIGDGARLDRCVVGSGAKVGKYASLGAGAALAAGSRLGDYSQL